MIRHGRTDGKHMGLDRQALSHTHTYRQTHKYLQGGRHAVVSFSLPLTSSCQNGCIQPHLSKPWAVGAVFLIRKATFLTKLQLCFCLFDCFLKLKVRFRFWHSINSLYHHLSQWNVLARIVRGVSGWMGGGGCIIYIVFTFAFAWTTTHNDCQN